LITEAKDKGDSLGGIVETVIKGCPAGLGDPVFDKLDALLAHAILSIGTIKGIEFGTGFMAAGMRGSEHNDEVVATGKDMHTKNNFSGGILGGISCGEDILFRAAVKPPSSIGLKQKALDKSGNISDIEIQGRHDPCLCPRIVPVIEAMTALVLVDCWLTQKTIQ
jgi:chorismate synthase